MSFDTSRVDVDAADRRGIPLQIPRFHGACGRCKAEGPAPCRDISPGPPPAPPSRSGRVQHLEVLRRQFDVERLDALAVLVVGSGADERHGTR